MQRLPGLASRALQLEATQIEIKIKYIHTTENIFLSKRKGYKSMIITEQYFPTTCLPSVHIPHYTPSLCVDPTSPIAGLAPGLGLADGSTPNLPYVF